MPFERAAARCAVPVTHRRTRAFDGSVWIVTTCMGRLGTLREALPSMLNNADFSCCLVDWSCPDGSADWAEHNLAAVVQEGRLLCHRVPNQRYFHKTRALNLGARHAIARGAEALCFTDADTLLLPGTGEWLRSHISPRSFFVSALNPDGTDSIPHVGWLMVPVRAFRRIGGYDEGFRGWGVEDLDLRARLFLQAGLDVSELPLHYLGHVPHDPALRTAYYEESNHRQSWRRNRAYFHAKLEKLSGESWDSLKPRLQRILGCTKRTRATSLALEFEGRGDWRPRVKDWTENRRKDLDREGTERERGSGTIVRR